MSISSSQSLLPISEKAFHQQVEQYAKLMRWSVYHSFLSIRSEPGFPDMVLVRPPRLIFVELKSDRGKLTWAQQQWIDLLGECPGVEC